MREGSLSFQNRGSGHLGATEGKQETLVVGGGGKRRETDSQSHLDLEVGIMVALHVAKDLSITHFQNGLF